MINDDYNKTVLSLDHGTRLGISSKLSEAGIDDKLTLTNLVDSGRGISDYDNLIVLFPSNYFDTRVDEEGFPKFFRTPVKCQDCRQSKIFSNTMKMFEKCYGDKHNVPRVSHHICYNIITTIQNAQTALTISPMCSKI